MNDWLNIPVKTRIELLREYKKQGYTYSAAKSDFENSYKSYQNGGEITNPKPVVYNNIQPQEVPSSTRVSTKNPQFELELLNRNLLKQDLLQKSSQGDTEAELQFRDVFGTSTHRYRYDNDPNYKQQVDQELKNWKGDKINYPSDSPFRQDAVPYNMRWMYPQLTDEAQREMTDFSNDVIGMALPIPGLEAMGKIPSVFKAGKNLIKPVSKVVGKTDDVIKSTVYNEGENKILDFFTPKNTKKASSEFTFENIPDRKFNTLDDFKTKYKSDYQVTTDKRTFKGKPLDATKTGKEESNYFTRNVDDKIEKHYNNEITLQKFKDYGGDEKSFQTLIDNINTPSKTVQGSLNNASGLLTDEGVSLAVHNKYLDPNEAMQTLFHEKGHQSKIVASTKEGSLLPNLWEDISKLSGYSKYTSADKGSIGMYMDHPSEIYSRIMELKYKANLKPYENFTKELLEKIGGVERDASGKITRMSGLMPTSYSKNEERWLKLINKAPVLIPAIGSGIYFQSQQNETKE